MVVTVGEALAMIHAHMVKTGNIYCVINSEGIGINNAVRADFFLNDQQHRFGPGIGNDGRIDLAFPLQQAKDGYLARRSATTSSLAHTTEITLVGFYLTGEFVAG